MTTRRKFIKLSAIGSGAVLLSSSCAAEPGSSDSKEEKTEGAAAATATDSFTAKEGVKPVVISTWNHGIAANDAAWKKLEGGGNALDASEAGVMVTESDPENLSVGLGGLPDRDGNVTLDACIMNAEGDCGAVAFLQHIENPISVARLVMEKTPHVMLVGQGALEFALTEGFEKKDLLTEKAKEEWEKWKEESKYQPVINIENQEDNHDTIGMLVLDKDGNLSGACTTSGMAYKLHGRVGDSPIIGAGLFVDNEVGAACATGVGEAVIRVCGSHLVVELMRQGKSPEEACKEAVERIKAKHKNLKNLQVGFLALNKNGEHGGYSVYNGFNYALRTPEKNEMVATKFDREW